MSRTQPVRFAASAAVLTVVLASLPAKAQTVTVTYSKTFQTMDGWGASTGYLAANVNCDLLGKIAPSHSGGDVGDVADLRCQIVRHRVDVVSKILPGAPDPTHVSLTAELTFRADFPRYATHFGRECVELIDHGVERVLEL